MDLKSRVFLIATIMTVFSTIMMPFETSAETNQNSVTITPINDEISLQKTITTMKVPEDNQLPWGIVKGAASDYVERYPVIIQFYKGEEPIHFAQVDVIGDGSFEYKFRVGNINSDTGEFVNIYEGEYTVKIFRVVPNTNDRA